LKISYDHIDIAQMDERLADRRTADAEFTHQIAFRRQEVAGIIGLVDDARFQPCRDLLIELLWPDWPALGWYTCHTSYVNPSRDGVKHVKVESGEIVISDAVSISYRRRRRY
jgi:hypothetical protein